MSLPAGYRTVEAAGATGFAREADASWVEEALREHGSLDAWARAAGRPLGAGRGAVHAVAAPTDEVVVRHYRRGGWMAPLLGDRYLATGTPRPVAELHATVAVRRRDVPAPAVVAGTVHPDGLFYRADLVTERIPGADLDAVLWSGDSFWDAPRALEAAGRFVRRLEQAGVAHPDLNAKNLLVNPHENDGTLYLLDLDRCRVLDWAGGLAPGPMRARLRRSLRKLGARHGRPLDAEAWAALDRGLGEVP